MTVFKYVCNRQLSFYSPFLLLSHSHGVGRLVLTLLVEMGPEWLNPVITAHLYNGGQFTKGHITQRDSMDSEMLTVFEKTSFFTFLCKLLGKITFFSAGGVCWNCDSHFTGKPGVVKSNSVESEGKARAWRAQRQRGIRFLVIIFKLLDQLLPSFRFPMKKVIHLSYYFNWIFFLHLKLK